MGELHRYTYRENSYVTLAGDNMENKQVTREDLNKIIKEEYTKLREALDTAGIRNLVTAASKLIDAVAAFEKDLPAKAVEATSKALGELKGQLESMVGNPQQFLTKATRVVNLRPVKESVGAKKVIGTDPSKLKEVEPAAYKALPSSYKNDRALTFYYNENGELCADHDLGGTWQWKVAPASGKGKWIRIDV